MSESKYVLFDEANGTFHVTGVFAEEEDAQAQADKMAGMGLEITVCELTPVNKWQSEVRAEAEAKAAKVAEDEAAKSKAAASK